MALCATLAHCALACGADSDHGPPIGSPTGPVGPITNEGGSSNGTGGAGTNANAGTGANPAIDGTSGGALNGPGSAGASSLGIAGANGPGGDAFGSGGFATGSDPFARAGGLNAAGGTSFF